MISYDEDKRQINLKEHGLDFIGVDKVFDYPVLSWQDNRFAYGEQRINLLGWLQGKVVHLTYTERDEHLHIISLRKATKYEIQQYRQSLSR